MSEEDERILEMWFLREAREQRKANKLLIEQIKFMEAIENLLKERQEDKEKIKELEEEIDNWKFTAKYVEDNYISKDNLREILRKYEYDENYTKEKFYKDLKELVE